MRMRQWLERAKPQSFICIVSKEFITVADIRLFPYLRQAIIDFNQLANDKEGDVWVPWKAKKDTDEFAMYGGWLLRRAHKEFRLNPPLPIEVCHARLCLSFCRNYVVATFSVFEGP